MNYSVFAIYDKELGKVMSPFIADSRAVASRQFMLGMKSVPAEVRPSLYLVEITHFDIDDSSVEVNYPYVAYAGELDLWLESHSDSDSKAKTSKKRGSK